MTVQQLLKQLDERPEAVVPMMACALSLRAIRETDADTARGYREKMRALMSELGRLEGEDFGGTLTEIDRVTDEQLAGFIDGVVGTLFLLSTVENSGMLLDEGLLGSVATHAIFEPDKNKKWTGGWK